MAARVMQVTALTNVLPFEDEAVKAELFEKILGRPLPARVTIYPPVCTATTGSTSTSRSACSSTRAAPSWTTSGSGSATM